MSTEEFIIALFDRVDDAMGAVAKHPQAALYPSELVTLALLFALKGVGERAFYRWLVRDWLPLFPQLPERTRLFRLFTTHHAWVDSLPRRPRRSSGWRIPTASNSSIRGGKGAARSRSARKG